LKHDLLAVQLHGKESVAFCESVAKNSKRHQKYGVFSIQDEFDFRILEPFGSCSDYFLFLILRGITWTGNGTNFRLEDIRKLSFYKTIFLSGGI
jgi:phosphoribosylanthranilate isomerase